MSVQMIKYQGSEEILKNFCDESVKDDEVINKDTLKCFTDLFSHEDIVDGEPVFGESRLQGRFFLGLNVKTDSGEPLNPISFWCKDPDPGYIPKQESIAEGGRIMDLFDHEGKLSKPKQDNRFIWNPTKWHENSEEEELDELFNSNSAVSLETLGNSVINEVFRTPYGKDYDKNKSVNKQNLLGDIYYNALKLHGEDCYVWIYFFDYDLSNSYNLSFIVAVCEKKEDREKIMSKKDDLVNYIMLVKARYVRKLERQRQKESVKSAVAAIMSRNMSHNLGSHYLYYTKMQLAALADRHEQSAPDIRGAARVLGYMQARMDYLATIVSDDKYPYGGVFFKGQIFDELTIDDFSKRHFQGQDSDGKERKYRRTTNYLLQNLILSENFTRGPVIDGNPSLLEEKITGTQTKSEDDGLIKRKNIRLQIRIDSGTYTGSPKVTQVSLEEEKKLEISKICIALPGSIMTIHAFYNVVENLIRNSAKYKKDDFGTELVMTIAIKELPESDTQPNRYQIVIYDNKGNALKDYSASNSNRLVDEMNDELGRIQILNERNELDKSSKGLKEMLFSILWMRLYTYDKEERLSDILAQLDREKDPKKKLDEIKRHAFEYVAVLDDGESEWKMLEPDENGHVRVNQEESHRTFHLGIRFELPKWRMLENLDAAQLDDDMIKEKGVNNFTDIRCIDTTGLSEELHSKLKTVFTRVYDKGVATNEKDEKEALEIMKKVLAKRFPEINDYRIGMDSVYENGFLKEDLKQRGIYFKSHESDLAEMEKYAYCEAISGENFTKTMQNIFNDSFMTADAEGFFSKVTSLVLGKKPQPEARRKGDFKDDASEYFALKIKEAALTRITLVDERLFNNMVAVQHKGDILKYKNIRILNLKNSADHSSLLASNGSLVVKNMFDGNEFRDGSDATHFLSIHLGMIEKIVKEDSEWVKANELCEASVTDRVNKLMDTLKKTFRTDQGELFISIHSGRGNFSKELDESLSAYPFISISAIENVYANSKFLLAQLFYDTVYIGKGELNKKSKKEDNNG